MDSKLKESKIGQIPEEWEAAPLNRLVNITTGKKDVNEGNPDGGYPFFTCAKEHTYSDSFSFDCEALLVAGNANVGRTSYYSGKFEAYQRTYVLSAFDNVIAGYLQYYLQKNLEFQLQSTVHKSAMSYIKLGYLNNFIVALPPLPEQRKIAEILSTVDEAIEKTDTIIQETQQLEKGLMQKLFTEGIRHTKFKDTKIGRIPGKWEIARMVNITKQFISGGTPETSVAEYWNGDIPWITGVFVTERTVYKGERYITSQGLAHSATHIVPKGGLLLVTRTNVGNVAVAGTDIAISQDLTGIVLDETQAESDFIVWYLLQNSQNLTRLQQGTTIQGIIRKDVEKILVVLPSLAEQRKIVGILSEVDTKIKTEQAYKSELEYLKKGLMQVLLTGQVRVKV